MPYSSTEELRKSKLYATLSELHGFNTAKLEKFINVFNAAYERVKRNGGSESQAESTGISIALSAAKRASLPAMNASLEEERHYFAPMMPQQLGGNAAGIEGYEFTFNLVKKDLDFVKIITAGNVFNWDHDGQNALGVIHDVVLPSELPEGVAGLVDGDAPFVFVASYYKDIPPESRSEVGISAEWLTFGEGSASDAIPLTFAVSHTPLNGPETGIKRVASIPDLSKSYKEGVESLPEATNMPDKTPEVIEAKEDYASLKTEHDALVKDFTSLKNTLASLTGTKDEEKFDAKTALASIVKENTSLKNEVEKQSRILGELKAAALDKEAEDFSQRLVSEGRLASDKAEEFASLYKEQGREKAEKFASLLPRATVGAHEARAAIRLEAGDDEALKRLDAAIKGAF